MRDKLKVVFDADMILFECCAACEKDVDWNNGTITRYVEKTDLQDALISMITRICEKVINKYQYEGRFDIVLAFSSMSNFRKKINPEYKANRHGHHPIGYVWGKEFLQSYYRCVEREDLEADDILGLYCTHFDNVVIVSGDKDMKTLPARFYNYMQDEFYEISLAEADKNFFIQTLTGDLTDNYKGCPGVGKVTAQRMLDKDCSWQTVVNAFKQKGLTEEDALTNARMAFILRAGYYKNGKVKLWLP